MINKLSLKKVTLGFLRIQTNNVKSLSKILYLLKRDFSDTILTTLPLIDICNEKNSENDFTKSKSYSEFKDIVTVTLFKNLLNFNSCEIEFVTESPDKVESIIKDILETVNLKNQSGFVIINMRTPIHEMDHVIEKTSIINHDLETDTFTTKVLHHKEFNQIYNPIALTTILDNINAFNRPIKLKTIAAHLDIFLNTDIIPFDTYCDFINDIKSMDKDTCWANQQLFLNDLKRYPMEYFNFNIIDIYM